MYTFDSRIRYSETDENAVLTTGSLINYFQDCSTFQTQDAGAGLDWLRGQGLAWVLSYWQIDIARLPRLYERVRVGTVPYALKGFMGLRNYCMDTVPEDEDQKPKRIAVANSVWALMDMEKMVPARITEEHASRYRLEEKLEMTYLDRKISLQESGRGVERESITVSHTHLDTNRHVNNGQYVRIALEASGKTLPTDEPVRIRAEYKKQAHLGDLLVPVVHEYDGDTPSFAVELLLNREVCCVVEVTKTPG